METHLSPAHPILGAMNIFKTIKLEDLKDEKVLALHPGSLQEAKKWVAAAPEEMLESVILVFAPKDQLDANKISTREDMARFSVEDLRNILGSFLVSSCLIDIADMLACACEFKTFDVIVQARNGRGVRVRVKTPKRMLGFFEQFHELVKGFSGENSQQENS